MNFNAHKVPDDQSITEHNLFERANQEWDAGNVEKAFELFNLAASEGDTYALNSIGYFFDHGIGMSKDREKALSWYRKAAKSGDSCAYSNIGLVHRDSGNIRRAKFWLSKAVDEGDGDAALELAKLHLQGPSKRSRELAMKYLQVASKSDSITQASREEAELLLKDVARI
ncbi:tetratricopeptide repeat protein [Paraherbaspirillum soli]|uniref:Tetratricopeptide repeat protein n=1 Tax=Paraherbaspirillum soli TaxID=631222 RepID=A0ABW0MCJ7_9BURK